MEPFRDREEAGRELAGLLGAYAGRPDAIVLALPRGGVPVGFEVAQALRAPLDVFVVRKLGVPGHEELAMGAIASGGVRVLHQDLIDKLGISESEVGAVAAAEERELARRERKYRGERPPPDVSGKTVILVDDGLATGSTMRAAARALRKAGPREIVVAVPVAAESTCRELAQEADAIVCGRTPRPFYAVGQAYIDFSQTPDAVVSHLLEAARSSRGTAA